jgi:hypothetical protein
VVDVRWGRPDGGPAVTMVGVKPTDEPFRSLRHAAFQLGAAAMQVAHTGSPAQVERTVAILNEARRNVYAILAEDSSI